MAGYFDAGRGRKEALFEVKSLGTKTRFVDLVTLLSHSHPLPVFPACPARLLVELVVPLCVVQRVTPNNTSVRNFTKLSLRSYRSQNSEVRDSEGKTEEDRKLERIERFW